MLAIFLLAACDGAGAGDAGPPDTGIVPAIVLTVRAAMASATVPAEGGGVLVPRAGSQLYLVDLTLEARTVGPIPLGANALTLRLTDGTRSVASPMLTDGAAEGCRSRSVPLGSSVSCRGVFEVAIGAAPPEILEWSDGTRTIRAAVPPLEEP